MLESLFKSRLLLLGKGWLSSELLPTQYLEKSILIFDCDFPFRASESKSSGKEPEPKTAEKWREMFGKSEIESTDIFEHFKDSPPVR